MAEVKIVAPQTRCPVCHAAPLVRCRDVTTGVTVDRVHRAREQRCADAMAELICDHALQREEVDRSKGILAAAYRTTSDCVVPGCGQPVTRHLSYGLEIAERVGGDPLDYVERRRAALDG